SLTGIWAGVSHVDDREHNVHQGRDGAVGVQHARGGAGQCKPSDLSRRPAVRCDHRGWRVLRGGFRAACLRAGSGPAASRAGPGGGQACFDRARAESPGGVRRSELAAGDEHRRPACHRAGRKAAQRGVGTALAWQPEVPGPGVLPGRAVAVFGGWSPELLDSELVAWPAVARNDLKASYLAAAAGQIGTSVTNHFIHGVLHEALRRRVFDAIGAGQVADAVALGTLPDHWAARAPGITMADLAKLLGFDQPPPGATKQDLRNELKLEAPLAVQASGGRSCFFPFNKFSSLPLLIEAARAAQDQSGGDDSRKRLMNVDDCHVTGLQRDGDRISVIQTQQGPIDVPAAAVVGIALGTIESARLALISTGNPRGLMGRNLMAHLRSNLTLRVPRAAFPGLPPDLESSALFVKGRHAGRHFHIQLPASGVVGNVGDSEAELFKKIPDIDFFDAHKLVTDDRVVITLRGIGEMQGDHTGAGSRVEQDPEPDEYTVPRAKVL